MHRIAWIGKRLGELARPSPRPAVAIAELRSESLPSSFHRALFGEASSRRSCRERRSSWQCVQHRSELSSRQTDTPGLCNRFTYKFVDRHETSELWPAKAQNDSFRVAINVGNLSN